MTSFETAILEFIVSETSDRALHAQLKGARVTEREHTGVGCYSSLECPTDMPVTSDPYRDRGPVTGPNFESPQIKYGGGSLLWFKDGLVSKLEIYTHEGEFPKNHDDILEFKLSPGIKTNGA
jgi:hypothetical protein